jgi:TonB family protein
MKHTLKRILACLVLLVAFGPAVIGLPLTKQAPPGPPPVHNKWALLIGIGKFQDPTIAPIKFAVKNTTDLATLLKDPSLGRFSPDHVAVISGNHATKSGIEQAIDTWLLKKALPNDLVLVYICTRSLASKDGTDVYLCSYDTLASEPAPSGVSLLETLTLIAKRTQSHRVLAALDLSPAARGNFPDAARIANESGVSVLSANKLSEPSYESSLASTSYFVQYLLEGVKAGGGFLPLNVVAQYLQQNIPAEVTKSQSKDQMPELVLAPNAQELSGIAIGVQPKETAAMSSLDLGHRMDRLGVTRPDLVASRKPAPAKEDDEDEDDEARPGVSFGAYMTKMKQDIQKKWAPPKGLENRHVTTVFTILRDGTIVNPSIVEGSGDEDIDKAALQALHNASPLDALPLGAPKSVQIRYKFDWRVSRN